MSKAASGRRRPASLAYAYPTYEGSSVKRDVPAAEQPLIVEIAQLAARTQQAADRRGARQPRGPDRHRACPLAAPGNDLAAWTMTRTHAGALAAQTSLRAGLGALLAFVLVSGLWLGLILLARPAPCAAAGRHACQASADGDARARAARAPACANSTASSTASTAIACASRRRARSCARRRASAARDQRLAALGRMTGGIAHEIRNPIAAMRLKAENALAARARRGSPTALRAIVGQIDRLEGLVQSLLALVQPLTLTPRDGRPARAGSPSGWPACAPAPRRAASSWHRTSTRPAAAALFDPVHLARAIDNLLDNAVRHAPRGRPGASERSASGPRSPLRLRVDDDGAGVPEALAAAAVRALRHRPRRRHRPGPGAGARGGAGARRRPAPRRARTRGTPLRTGAAMARILIVDDDDAFRETLAETLQSLGHDVGRSRRRRRRRSSAHGARALRRDLPRPPHARHGRPADAGRACSAQAARACRR